MADNVNITPGTGNIVAADEVTDGTLGMVKVQYTKLMDGTIDSTNKLVVSAAGAAKVDGSAVTQPISAASLPLPSTAATSTKQSDGTQKTQIVDGSGNVIASTSNALNVDVTNTVPVTLSSTTITGSVTVVQPTGTNLHAVLDSGTTTVTQATGTNLHTVIDSGSVTLTGSPAISGTVTANQGTAAATTAGWPIVNGTVTPATAAWTSSTATDTALSIATTGYGTILLTVNPSGTITGGTLNFEASADNGSTWHSINVTREQNGSSISGFVFNMSGEIGYIMQTDVAGCTNFRVRLNPQIVGSGTESILVTAFSDPISRTVLVSQLNATSLRAQLSDGTNNTSVTAGGALKVDASATTQPVSLASTTITGNVTVVQGTGTNLHAVIDSGTTTVTQATGTNLHTVVDSGTLTAVTAITNALPAGTNVIGHVIADSGSTTTVTGNVTAVQATGTNLHTVLDSGTVTSITNAVTVAQATAASLNATVTQQTLTKGTQGSTGVSTQDLKDSGRNYVTFTANAVAGVTAEALFSFNQTKQGVATASVTSYTVTSGKTLRIMGLYLSNQDGTTTTAFGRAILRHNTAGATTTSSSVVAIIQTGGSAALASSTGFASAPFPEGIEIYGNGTQSIGVSHLDQATTNVVCCTLVGYEY